MSIGKRLLSLRQQKGMSQEELANQLHVSRQTISKWESDLSLPDMKTMLDISDFFQISITELLGIEEDNHNHLNFPNHNFSFQKMNAINLYNVPPRLMNY